MNIDEITRKYLESCVDDPSTDLPEGWEYKFGIRGKFKRYNSIEELEQAHLEYVLEAGCHSNRVLTRPFAYCIPTWGSKEKPRLLERMLPGDEIWEITQNGSPIIWIIRNGDVILKEYPAVKTFIGGTTVKLPDPDFYFSLDAL